MAKKGKGFVNAIGKLGKEFGKEVIADTVLGAMDMANNIVKEAAPIVDKALDRQYEHQKNLVKVPNLVDMPLQAAQDYCEEIGLRAVLIELPAHAKYASYRPNRIIDTDPKPSLLQGGVLKGSLIKLRYIDDETLAESKLKAKKADQKKTEDQQKLLKQLPVVKLPLLGEKKK